jgi:3-hydroxyacyl-CoA dehydrogenase/enoyl-CoA hydratase/3-hydroxybutyryl-CoA epimerase
LADHIRKQTIADLEKQGAGNKGAIEALSSSHSGAVVDKMLSLKRPGRAGGGGFYEYTSDGKHLWPELTKHFPTKEPALSQQEMIDRILYIQSIETARCLEEGVLRTVPDANLGSIFGWGFAPQHGGTLQFINAVGLPAFVARAKELAATYGDRFTPPQLLVSMAEKGERF